MVWALRLETWGSGASETRDRWGGAGLSGGQRDLPRAQECNMSSALPSCLQSPPAERGP